MRSTRPFYAHAKGLLEQWFLSGEASLNSKYAAPITVSRLRLERDADGDLLYDIKRYFSKLTSERNVANKLYLGLCRVHFVFCGSITIA